MAGTASVRLPQLRVRAWLSKLPLFTRVIFAAILIVHTAGFFIGALAATGALTPSEVSLLRSMVSPFTTIFYPG